MIAALDPKTRLTTPEAAEYMGLEVKTLHNYRSAGTGPACIRVGRCYQYRVEDIEKYLDRNRVEPIR
ncbi:helix-turn-helix domain-containing protein [Rothia koreensis]|uniref:helix-turn-helix domain-containing protein n=1 Tax=Rothia koreensis TaxID=592378 RepID=UPI003FCE9E0A